MAPEDTGDGRIMVYFSNNYVALAPTKDPYGDGILLQTLDGYYIELSMETLENLDERNPEDGDYCARRLTLQEALELANALMDAVHEVRDRKTHKHIEERQLRRIKEGKCSSEY